MTFLDTGILVGALLKNHPEHARCRAAFEQHPKALPDAHALAETFATLSGFYDVPMPVATELALSLQDTPKIEALRNADYETAIREAQSRGVIGEGFTFHCTRPSPDGKKVRRIVTRNPSRFMHVAPEVEILTP